MLRGRRSPRPLGRFTVQAVQAKLTVRIIRQRAFDARDEALLHPKHLAHPGDDGADGWVVQGVIVIPPFRLPPYASSRTAC